ncbi:MAG: hypothetical protein WBC02_10055 [Candidatus Aminicenantaceae bacterium]
MRIFIVFSLIGFLLIATDCATIPSEAPDLSVELGKRIQATREAHIALVRAYMGEKRLQVDEFVLKEWVPELAKTLFSENRKLREAWEEVIQSNDPDLRMEFIGGLVLRIQKKISEKHYQFLKPINDIEINMVRNIQDHYDQIISINATLTSFLVSASKVSESRDRVLRMLQADDKFTGFLDKADEVVNLIIEKKNGFEENKKKIEEIVESVKNLK